MFTLSIEDLKAWEAQGKEVKLCPCVEVRRTVRHSTFSEVQRKWLVTDARLSADKLREAVAVAEVEAARRLPVGRSRDGATGRCKVVAIVDNVTVETPACMPYDVCQL